MESINKLSHLPADGIYSYADYLSWQLKERVELIRGRLFPMAPAPARHHQKISSNLHGLIWQFLDGKPCEVYSAPFDVRLPDQESGNPEEITTVVQPDLCVICDAQKLDDAGCLGAPDLIIEILSPRSLERDVKEKYVLYEAHGVREYWLVYQDLKLVEVFFLEGDKFVLQGKYLKDDDIPSQVLKGMELKVAAIFQ